MENRQKAKPSRNLNTPEEKVGTLENMVEALGWGWQRQIKPQENCSKIKVKWDKEPTFLLASSFP